MALSSGRVLANASVVLYDEGDGDPYVTDHGFAWRDNPLESALYASLSVNALGRSYLEFLPEIGLTCKPRLVYQDVNLAHYATGLGSWERRRLGTGTPLTYRLVQYDTTADLTYSAGGPGLPANPQVCFSLILPDTPSDWDSVLYPPYVRIELAGGYALEWDREGGRLLKLDATTAAWKTCCDLPQLISGDYTSGGENFIFLRCLRGRIGISTDYGREYKWYGEPGSISIPAGAFTLRGRGGSVVFGLHQLAFSEGVYTSPRKNTLATRATATVTSSNREDLNGGAIVLADLSSFASAYAQYTATLTPSTTAGTPFTYHGSPVLYAATIRYNVVKTTPTLANSTPWDSRLLSIDINKPYELAGGTCDIRVKLPPNSTLTGNYRWRKVGVYLGTKVGAAAPTSTLMFTGYISSIAASSQEWGDTELSVTLQNGSVRFRRAAWEPNQCLALSELAAAGASVNEIGDFILASEGLGSTYRIWHVRGNAMLLPLGSVAEPFELIRPGEYKWETLTRIFGYIGLEIGVMDDGTFVTVLLDYYSGTVHAMDAREVIDIEKLPLAIGMVQDYNEVATAVYVTGEDAAGGPIIAGAVDVFAETSTGLGTFCPWREAIVESMPDTCNAATAGFRAGELARNLFGVRKEADIQAFVKLAIARRDQVELFNTAEYGIPDATNYVVLSLRHSYSQQDGEAVLSTSAGLRRIA